MKDVDDMVSFYLFGSSIGDVGNLELCFAFQSVWLWPAAGDLAHPPSLVVCDCGVAVFVDDHVVTGFRQHANLAWCVAAVLGAGGVVVDRHQFNAISSGLGVAGLSGVNRSGDMCDRMHLA